MKKGSSTDKKYRSTNRTNEAIKTSWTGLIINFMLSAAKAMVGLASGSISVLADGLHNLSDFFSSGVMIIGFYASKKPADDKHPFGHARSEYLSGFIVSLVVIFAGLQFLTESVDGLFAPSEVDFSPTLVAVLLISIIFKVAQAVIFYRSSKKLNSNALHATFIDGRNDALTTMVILVGIASGYFLGWNLDGLLGVVVSIFVIYSGLRAVSDSIDDLLGARPIKEIERATRLLDTFTNIAGYHDLLIHAYGPNNIFASVHIEVPANTSLLESHEIADKIEKDFRRKLDISMVAHVDLV